MAAQTFATNATPASKSNFYAHSTPGAAHGTIRLLHLYPHDMNIYGDWGNVLVLARRAQWQGYDVEILTYNPGMQLPQNVHLIVGGGGQDSGQVHIKNDLLKQGAQLRALTADGLPALVICGLYQLFGQSFITATGTEIPGIGVFKAQTKAGQKRLIGNIALESSEFGTIVGYENHSGLTTLAAGVKAFGTVLSGGGNNGTDHLEGARVNHVIGTYLHGSLLPKNPVVADWLLARACEFAGMPWEPVPLADPVNAWTRAARAAALKRPR